MQNEKYNEKTQMMHEASNKKQSMKAERIDEKQKVKAEYLKGLETKKKDQNQFAKEEKEARVKTFADKQGKVEA